MAGSSEDRRRRHRRSRADLRDAEREEGELVPGCDSDVDTDDYYNNHDYYSSTDSDETISDCNARSSVPASYGGASAASPSSTAAAAAAKNNNGNAGSSSPVAAPPAAELACPICGKEFRSRKAVCGHMKVHQHGAIGRHEQQQQAIGKGKPKGIRRNVAAVAVAGGWGGTGKRGCSGCWSKPASPNAQSDQSMAMVVANPQTALRPMPLAFAPPNSFPVRIESATPNPTPTSSVPLASGSPGLPSVPIPSTMTKVSDGISPAKPMHSDDAMETVVAEAADPPTKAAVHPHSTPSTPPAAVHATSVHEQPIEQTPPPPPPPPDAEERVQLPPVEPPHTIAPPLAAAAGRQNPNGYTCKHCGAWYAMHQGLGGHMAGHKTRELAAVPCRPDAKPVKEHTCKRCDAVFATGVQLGGHMRKHYDGAPIVPKKKPRLVIQPLPPPPEQSTIEPAPRPAVAGRLRLFGVDIAAGVQTPAPAPQEEGSSASATQAPSASTGGEQ